MNEGLGPNADGFDSRPTTGGTKAAPVPNDRHRDRGDRFRQAADSRLLGILLIILLLAVWQWLAVTETLSPFTWPRVTAVARSLVTEMIGLELPRELGLTIYRLLLGFAAATVVGVIVGVAMGSIPLVHRLLEPLTELLRPIPVSALVPVAILFFGLGSQMKISMVLYASLWPILLNSFAGVRWVDPVLLNTGRTFGLNFLQILWYIRLRAALPYIATGMRISLAVALVVAVVAEMIAGGDGVGAYLLQRQRTFQVAEMYAGIVSLALLGYLLNFLFMALQKRVLFWTEEQST